MAVDILELKELTSKLYNLEELITSKQNDIVEYGGIGHIIGINIFNDSGGKVAIQRAFMSVGSEIVRHKHDENEWLIVYEGAIQVELEDCVKNLSVGESIYIKPDVIHICRALEDSWIIGITIPASKGYPDGRK